MTSYKVIRGYKLGFIRKSLNLDGFYINVFIVDFIEIKLSIINFTFDSKNIFRNLVKDILDNLIFYVQGLLDLKGLISISHYSIIMVIELLGISNKFLWEKYYNLYIEIDVDYLCILNLMVNIWSYKNKKL